MTPILEKLIEILIERFSAAGFVIPETMSQKERESFVFHALDNAEILPADEYRRLVAAGREVVRCWEGNRLASAVRKLAAELPDERRL